MIEEPGALRDRVEEAWQSIRLGLVRAVSIGFRPIEYAFMDTGGVHFQQIEVFELSVVTIPAQAEAVIFPLKTLSHAAVMAIKSFDVGAPAAIGHDERPVDVNRTPGVPGSDATRKTRGARVMPKTIAEQIGAFEATRAAKAARMQALMAEAAEKGETLDAEQEQEYDTLAEEVRKIDKHLERLRALEAHDAQKAKPVDQVKSAAEASAVRGGVVVRHHEASLPPGVRFARIAKAKALAHLTHSPAAQIAAQLYGADSEAAHILQKAGEVVAGSNLQDNWASALTGPEGSAFADFVSFLRPATIIGKFGTNGIPSLRVVPFRMPLISQTGGGAGYWVGEGKPKPLTAFDFERTTLEPLKCANIAVLTEENVRSSNPNSELIIRDALRDALVARMDADFIDPSNSGSSGVKPASITNGAPSVKSTGTDADDIRLDVRAVFQKFIEADNPPENGVWIMSTTNALALSLMVNALGQREFPGITMTGGTFEGMPVIASRYAGDNVALVNASDIYLGDEGGVSVDMSREASLEMKSTGLSQDATTGTGAQLVSLWQSNLVGLRAERTINWMRRRTSAVAYLTDVQWGGTVPAS